jgi:hypothetical protein
MLEEGYIVAKRTYPWETEQKSGECPRRLIVAGWRSMLARKVHSCRTMDDWLGWSQTSPSQSSSTQPSLFFLEVKGKTRPSKPSSPTITSVERLLALILVCIVRRFLLRLMSCYCLLMEALVNPPWASHRTSCLAITSFLAVLRPHYPLYKWSIPVLLFHLLILSVSLPLISRI